MAANNVTPEELQTVVGQRGYFPADMPVKDYPADFVSGCLVAAWPQVLEMIYQLKSENNTSMILITHDLGVVAQNCDYVAIIYAGEVVEYGSLREIYKDTKHPYTEGLFGSIPSLTSDVTRLQTA